MAEVNFTLDNQWFALSPMVLRAKAEEGSVVTLIVTNDGDLEGARHYVSINLTADDAGNIAFDISPIVRDLMARQFVRKNLGVTPQGISPYGATLDITIGGGYTMTVNVIWAVKDLVSYSPSLFYSALSFLVPSGLFRYHTGNLHIDGVWVYTPIAFKGLIKIKDKRTGSVTSMSVQQGVGVRKLNNGINIFNSLAIGEYRVYQDGREEYGFDMIVEKELCTDGIRTGNLAYIRYCNAMGGVSYALLQVILHSQKGKATYVSKDFALDGCDIFTTAPDRLMTGNEITRTFKAGQDRLSRADVEQMQAILIAPMVDRYDADTGGWIPVYPADATVNVTDAALQEITIEFVENTEGF